MHDDLQFFLKIYHAPVSMLKTFNTILEDSRPGIVWKAVEIQGWNLRLVYYYIYLIITIIFINETKSKLNRIFVVVSTS